MFDISRKTYEINGIETIVDKDAILLLNEKHIEEGLDHKILGEISTKYNSNYRKHRYELVEEPKKPKKSLISKVSTRLLGWKFESDNIIKSKAIKFIVKKYCLINETKVQMLEKLNNID